jgi:Domain of unknown function (DUF5658)
MSKHRIIGNVAVTCFILVQLLDWMATYQGLTLFGTSIEANPLLRSLMERYDIILVLTSAKLFATLAGSLLHLANRHLLVATLTVLCTVFSILPWINLFTLHPIF